MKKIITLLICLSLTFSYTRAQQTGSIKADTIFVVKDYKPLLADAEKYIFQAPLPQPDSSKLKLKYIVNAGLKQLPFIPAELRPIAMSRQDEQDKLQNGYVKAGFGTQYSPFIDAHYSNGRNDKIYFAANAYHFSGTGKPLYKNFSDTYFNTDVRLQFKKVTVGLGAGYKTNSIYYYGFDNKDSLQIVPSKNEVKRVYNLIQANLFLRNAIATKSNIDYQFILKENYFFTNGSVAENEIEAGFTISKLYNKVHHFNLGLGFNYTSISDTVSSGSYWLLPFHPYYEYKKGNLYARAGFNLVISDSLFFIPDVLAQYSLLDGKLIPYVRIDGFMDKNIMMYEAYKNPFINNIISRRIGQSYNFGGGVKGSISDYIVFAAEMNYRLYNYLPIYSPDSGYITRYSIAYAEQAGVFNPHVELGLRRNDKFGVTLKGDYFKYDLDYGNPAYGHPDWRITLNANYNMQDKILLTADVYANPPMTFQYTGKTSTVTTKGWVDANLAIIYNYKSNFGAYLRFNNIASSQYAKWYRYNSYAFVMNAGLVVKF